MTPLYKKYLLSTLLIVIILSGSLFLLDMKDNKQGITMISVNSSSFYPSFYTSFDIHPIQPIPLGPSKLNQIQQDKIALGQRLFNDKILSDNNSISCASCHKFDKGGADGQQYSQGIHDAIGTVNTPTVFNSIFNFSQFWDGRAETLHEQVAGPLLNSKEMGSQWPELIQRLKQHLEYPKLFKMIYPQGINSASISDTIAYYESSLTTPNSVFDQYLRGDPKALTKKQLAGYELFKDYGCVSCHQGVNIGGNMYQRFGIFEGYFSHKKVNSADLGRFNVTGIESDRHVFKVPSLRNIALTAPYFHDGSAQTLKQAIAIMGRYQLGRELSAQDVELLESFLQSLTGQWQGKLLQ